MPNNVYIGSRYVPIFDGAWDNTKSYEPLTIVEYGNNTYTSKRPVPVGTLPTNTSYWALTGNYNGQISNLQQQINDMKDGDVPGSLQNQIDDNTSDITALTNNIDGLSSAGECVFIGDSFGSSIVNILQTSFGFTVTYNNSIGGHGFKAGEYRDQLIAEYANVADPDKVKYVIAIGGTNDTPSAQDSTFKGYITPFCTKARELFPNARILIGFVSTLYAYDNRNQLKYKGNCKNMYIEGAANANVGAEFIDNLTEAISDCDKWLTNDRTHPNSDGYNRLATIIYQAIKRNPISMPTSLNTEYTKTNTSEGVSFTTKYYFANDGHGTIYLCLRENQTFCSGATLDNNHNYKLLETNQLPLTPIQRYKQLIEIDATHQAWIDLNGGGLMIYGGGIANLSGLSTLGLYNDVMIPITLY